MYCRVVLHSLVDGSFSVYFTIQALLTVCTVATSNCPLSVRVHDYNNTVDLFLPIVWMWFVGEIMHICPRSFCHYHRAPIVRSVVVVLTPPLSLFHFRVPFWKMTAIPATHLHVTYTCCLLSISPFLHLSPNCDDGRYLAVFGSSDTRKRSNSL